MEILKRQFEPSQHAEDNTCGLTLNDDVSMEILLRLPAKSLTRSKSVCKNWLSLISSQQFLHCFHTRRRHPKPQPSLILTSSTSDFFTINPFLKKVSPFNFNSIPNPKISTSCNGLMLIKSDHDHYVFNPTTKQSRKLSLTNNTMYPKVMGLSLAFDPSKSPHYKIVCLRKRKIKKEPLPLIDYQIEVYNSESHCWKICLEAFTFAEHGFSRVGKYCNNCIYWTSSYANIPFYDMATNMIKYLPCPNIKKSTFDGLQSALYFYLPPYIQELNGHLHYCFVEYHFTISTVTLWEMQGDNDDPRRWLLKFRVTRPPPPSLHDMTFSALVILNGPDHMEATCILMEQMGEERKKMTMCMFLDKSCRDDVDLRRRRFDEENVVELDFGYRDVHQVVECLALV